MQREGYSAKPKLCVPFVERLRKRKCVLVQKQNELNLKEALLRIDEVDTFQKVQSDGLYKKAISDLLKGKWD